MFGLDDSVINHRRGERTLRGVAGSQERLLGEILERTEWR